jgi:hypothetical protein
MKTLTKKEDRYMSRPAASCLLATVFALLASSVITAAAADFQCTASAVAPPIIRAEGRAERVSDLVLICTGGVSGNLITSNFQVFLNTTITSNILSGEITEALLLIDDPGPGSQVLDTNLFRATRAADNSIIWPGVTIVQPGNAGVRTIRLSNIRANANQLVFGGAAAVQVLVSSSGPFSFPIVNSSQTVAYAQSGMLFTVESADFDQSLAPGISDNPTEFLITFGENFPAAFRKKIEGVNQDIPGTVYNTESGFTSAATGPSGRADTGTRLVARFNNIPAGVFLSVPGTVRATGSPLEATLMVGVSPDFSGGTPASSGSVVLSEGSGFAVWEVINGDPLAIEEVKIPVTVSYDPGPVSGLPGLGVARVSGNLGPISPEDVMSAPAPEPRFADTSVIQKAFGITSTLRAAVSFRLKMTLVNGSPGGLRFNKFKDTFDGLIEIHEGKDGLASKDGCFVKFTGDAMTSCIKQIVSISTDTRGSDELILIGSGDFSTNIDGEIVSGSAHLSLSGKFDDDDFGQMVSIEVKGSIRGVSEGVLAFEGQLKSTLER